jgi:hypothetical protein
MTTIVDRLGAVPALAGRIQTAAKFSALLQANQLAQAALTGAAAFVLPIGLIGGAATAATGVFRQQVEWTVGVALVVRAAGDATGADGVVQLTPLIDDVISAIAGWGPDEAVGVYRVSRGELLSLTGGTLIYQLDFSIDDQLRITP